MSFPRPGTGASAPSPPAPAPGARGASSPAWGTGSYAAAPGALLPVALAPAVEGGAGKPEGQGSLSRAQPLLPHPLPSQEPVQPLLGLGGRGPAPSALGPGRTPWVVPLPTSGATSCHCSTHPEGRPPLLSPSTPSPLSRMPLNEDAYPLGPGGRARAAPGGRGRRHLFIPFQCWDRTCEMLSR